MRRRDRDSGAPLTTSSSNGYTMHTYLRVVLLLQKITGITWIAVVVGVNGRSNSDRIGMDGLTYSGELLTNYGAHWMGSIKQNMARAFLVGGRN